MATFADELEAKRPLKVGDAKTLNIYSTSISLGFAYYPKIVAGAESLGVRQHRADFDPARVVDDLARHALDPR